MESNSHSQTGIGSLSINEDKLEQLFVSKFGMSSEQFERELEIEFEQASPLERAELEQLVNQANDAIPQINASLEKIAGKLAGVGASMSELRESLSSMSKRIERIEESFASVGAI